MVMNNMYVKLDKLIPELEGLRTRIFYDSSVVKDLILFQYILPYYCKKSTTYLMLYSEALYYKFKRRATYHMFKDPKMAEVLDNIKIIKIGYNQDCEFGELCKFIKQSTPKEEVKGIVDAISMIENKSTLILYGSIAYFMSVLGERDALKLLVDMYSMLPDDITLFGFKPLKALKPIDTFVSDLYDVIITIKRDEMAFDHATYILEVECQLSDICYKSGKIKVEEGKLIPI